MIDSPRASPAPNGLTHKIMGNQFSYDSFLSDRRLVTIGNVCGGKCVFLAGDISIQAEENRMAVTLRDIAKHLNLSHATVSFVLNERLDVAIPDKTRQRVMDAARELGYRPNRAARA